MVRFAPTERDEVDGAAARAGETRSAFIRGAALARARAYSEVTDIQNSGPGEATPVTDIQNESAVRELTIERDEG